MSSKAFNSDTFIAAEVKRLIEKHNIQTVIETGTHQGNTAVWFVENVEWYCGIELKHEFQTQTWNKIESELPRHDNFEVHKGDSSKRLMYYDNIEAPFLFYLDAHWGPNWPLLDELKQIAEAGIKPVIVIHDFYNPNWKAAGLGEKHYDEYGGQKLDWDYVVGAVNNIYAVDDLPATYDYNYGHLPQSAGAKRGCIFIEPVN